MSDCTPPVCGTGLGTGPKPGDPPTNFASLTAVPGLGGIHVRWAYPSMLPHAVAHTLLYRSTTSEFNTAAERVVAGNTVFDQTGLEAGITYFYWIRMVTVNGTVGEIIGPAFAKMASTIGQIIDQLTGEINEHQLSTAIMARINRITELQSSLSTEEQERLLGDDYITQLLAQLQVQLDRIDTYYSTQLIEQITETEALVLKVDIMIAKWEQNRADILDASLVLADADSALSLRIEYIRATTDQNAAAILRETFARTTQDGSLAQSIETVQANVGELEASVQTVSKAVDGVEAQWFVKTDVNGVITGIGQYNGGTVDNNLFLIVANRFAIVSPQYDGGPALVPFIVDDDKVYIKKGLIQDLSVDTLQIAGAAITATDLKSTILGPDGSFLAYQTEFLPHGSTVVFNINSLVNDTPANPDTYDFKIRVFTQRNFFAPWEEQPGESWWLYANSLQSTSARAEIGSSPSNVMGRAQIWVSLTYHNSPTLVPSGRIQLLVHAGKR